MVTKARRAPAESGRKVSVKEPSTPSQLGDDTAAAPPESADSSRTTLLCVAKQLFARKGFAGTSLKALTDLAKVNVSLVSYHFGGKRGLYRACIGNFFARESSSPARVLVPPSSETELKLRFTLFVEEMLERYAEDPDAFKIIYHDLETEDELGDAITKQVFEIYHRHVEFLKSAQARGYLAADIDPQAASSILFSITHHLIRSDHVRKKHIGVSIHDAAYRKHMVQQITRIFFHGLLSNARGTP